MGYEKLRHFTGGLSAWLAKGLPLETGESAAARPPAARPAVPSTRARSSLSAELLRALDRSTFGQLLWFWTGVILVFGVLYWLLALAGADALAEAGRPITPDVHGLGDAIYFSFVTALSIGYGDVVPVGAARALALLEGFLGLLLWGCVISKLVSRRQEEVTDEIHAFAFEARLGRVRTNLHLVLSELQAIGAACEDKDRIAPERLRVRIESAAAVLEGEMQVIHDVLYRPSLAPEERALEAILVGLHACLSEVAVLLRGAGDVPRTPALRASLSAMQSLAGEICGECVPKAHAPHLKEWMDGIQGLAKELR